MDDKIVRCTIRLDRELFAKFRYVAEYEGRSANKAIVQMIKKHVQKFEKEVEKIPIGNLDTSDDDT